ncbi:unnamed protein product [Laminaria digitata]
MTLFPYFAGPYIRKFTSALLYSGRIEVSIPVSSQSYISNAFTDVYRSLNKNSPLYEVFQFALENSIKALRIAQEELDKLEPLGDKINTSIMFYPGDEEIYDDWAEVHSWGYDSLHSLLHVPSCAHIASVEFMWRVFELYSSHNQDPDKVCSFLEKRYDNEKPKGLLTQGLLNRFILLFMDKNGHFVTDVDLVLEVPSYVSDKYSTAEISNEKSNLIKEKLISFELFHKTIGNYTPLLDEHNVDNISSKMHKYEEELMSMREHCQRKAKELVVSDLDKEKLLFEIENFVDKSSKEISAILELDQTANRLLFQKLKEDPAIWTTISSALGFGLVGVPTPFTATMIIASFAKLGTNALTARRQKRESLDKDKWSFIYYLSH